MHNKHISARSSPKPSSKRLRVDEAGSDMNETPPSKRRNPRSPSKVARRLLVSPPEPPSTSSIVLEGCSTPESQVIKVRSGLVDVQPHPLDLGGSESSGSKRKPESAKGGDTPVNSGSKRKSAPPSPSSSKAKQKRKTDNYAATSQSVVSPKVESISSPPSPSRAPSKMTPKKLPFKDKEEERVWDEATEEFQKHQLEYFKKIDSTPL
eukprot:GGOE01049335.1.p1 GENE.GGOE01049335.1~~GGOE01049335.1.p1  ORF type:complete len:230 (-),score=39.27 GGOE01049335.1:359-982(-)